MTHAATSRARALRRNATEAERRLWSKLRRRRTAGFRFRRQRPVGPFIVDFVCLSARLVIEVDGGQHDRRRAYDERRTRYLEARGFRVLRFWNNDVLANTDGVVEQIMRTLQEPGGERGGERGGTGG
jgi:very-short-patch-repair endonuclease